MSKVVNVAVAVIHFNNQYLLGFRHASQHQGNRYEFVGGKIEPNETPTQGLIREVVEEIGCDLTNNFIVKMGVIRHDYGDKSVALHIFNSKVTQTQFDNLQHSQGIEGQAITWVSKADLLAKKYPLPDANVRILDWLTLPSTIFISQTLDEFASQKDWIDYYAKKLPQNAHFYIRPQSEDDKSVELITTLLKQRNHITPIIQYRTFIHLDLDLQNVIVHLNHHQLMTLDFSSLSKNYRYFASCHDQHSLSRLNTLATSHTVMGCFLSPVLATPTHPETFQSGGMGWQAFSELAKLSDVPVFALGGVGQSNLAMAWLSNAYGVAGIRLLVYKTMNF